MTIGVSIPIPDPHGDYLQSRRADFGDPAAWDIPAHITLLPPTPVDEATYAAFLDHCRSVASTHAAFDVVLRGTGRGAMACPVEPPITASASGSEAASCCSPSSGM